MERDLPYVPGGGHRQQLDLFLPAGRDFASLLFVHGGSLTGGDRTEAPYAGVCAPFQRAGFACALMSYRLFPSVRWPEPARDVAAAFAWVKESIAARGGDPGRIFLAGHSSGCLLASLVAADPRFLGERGGSPSDIAGVIAIGCRLNDRVDTAGIPADRVRKHFETDPYDSMFGSPEALNDAVPAAHVAAGLPPFLIMMAESERFEPPILRDARDFAHAAKRAGDSVVVEVVAGRTHHSLIEKMASPDDPAFRKVLEFMKSPSR